MRKVTWQNFSQVCHLFLIVLTQAITVFFPNLRPQSESAVTATQIKLEVETELSSGCTDKRYFFTVESPNNKGRIKQRLP